MPDERVSAARLGYLGITVIGVVVGFIVFVDITRVLQCISMASEQSGL